MRKLKALSDGKKTQFTDDGQILLSCGDARIRYRGSTTCPYGRLATKNQRPFEAVVVHHNPPKRSLDWLIDYQIAGDLNRNGHFGYHFYVTADAEIIQGAPLNVRTNHIKGLGYKARKKFGAIAQNNNSLGVTCVGAEHADGFKPTEVQTEMVISLVSSVCQCFEIPYEHVFGHGEIQTDRHPTEGASIAKYIRDQAGM